MGVEAFQSRPDVLRRLAEGPLGAYVDLVADRLLKEGHSRGNARRILRVVAAFGRWLAGRGLGLRDVAEQTVERYCRRHTRPRCTRAALRRLLSVLREAHAIDPAPAAVVGEVGRLEAEFERYLSAECGLVQVSVIRHRPILRRFLRERCDSGPLSLGKLTAADITGFVERHARDGSPRSAQMMCWVLRSFLRYLRYRGEVSIDLASSVPTVRTWALTSLPTYLDARETERVLANCARQTPIERRNYAVLLLMARMGLRANEIRLLCLDDIDWESGRMTVRGKGGQNASMPLLKPVGAAIADYLRNDRPASDSRRVFVRHVAPHTGFATSGDITGVAKKALMRAGISGIARPGAHVFRHSLATQLLRAGASLVEIGGVLRHHKQDATRIYAKVDLEALRALALPWRGGVR